MLRLLLLLLSFCGTVGWLVNPVAAQQLRCGTPPLSEEQRRLLLETVVPAEQVAARGTAGLITYVPIKLHLIRRTDGTGGLTAAQIVTVMAACNEAYQPAGIQFYFCGTANTINDSRYFDDFNPTIEPQICPANDVRNVLNLYMVNSCRVGTFIAGGYAYFPGGANRAVITYGSGAGPGVYKHEFGHMFGLPHTQDGSNNPVISKRELVQRTNCATTGDLICDTPSDPYDRPGATASSCTYTGTIVDANSDLYTPDMANVMSYWCGGRFSAGQYGRMAAARLASYASLSCGTTNGPGAPTRLVATPSTNTVSLSWTASTGPVMGYYVERAASLADDFVTIGGTAPTGTTFTDARPPGLTTRYRVKPANAESSFSNVASATLLPLILASASGAHQGAEAYLSWATTAERDNAYFDVEVRPKDRAAFQPLDRVSSPASATTTQRQYELRDPQLLAYLADTVFYRLTGVGSSGTRTPLTTVPVAVRTIAVRDLRATKQDLDGLLSWTTLMGQEYGNAYFDVEVRPTNRSTFKPLARLVTKPGATAASQQAYELRDPSFLMYRADSVHYRLWGATSAKRTLLAQTTVSAAFPRVFSLQVYPNPFHDAAEARVLISRDGPGTMVLRDALGRVVWQHATDLLSGLNVFKLEALPALPQGLYFLSVRQQESVRTVKLCRD